MRRLQPAALQGAPILDLLQLPDRQPLGQVALRGLRARVRWRILPLKNGFRDSWGLSVAAPAELRYTAGLGRIRLSTP